MSAVITDEYEAVVRNELTPEIIWRHRRSFDVLLTVHLSIILVTNQLNAQILLL